MHPFTESVVEATALAWLESLGWAVMHIRSFWLKAVLRDTPLPKLIRRKIRVKNAELFLKERGLCWKI